MSELPQVLPIFPLTGSLLLPGNWLPLHIFEPRYRNMVEDDPGFIGMIQPLTPQQDNRVSGLDPVVDPADPEARQPDLYEVGCVGRIEECEQVAEGRYLIALIGVSRFRIREELPLQRGYRRVTADYSDFAGDLDLVLGPTEAPRILIQALTDFGALHGLTFDMQRLARLPCRALVNGLAMALPFEPAEKQALLEANSEQRLDVLLALLRMGVDLRSDPAEAEAPGPN